jgi:hypothetical protein
MIKERVKEEREGGNGEGGRWIRGRWRRAMEVGDGGGRWRGGRWRGERWRRAKERIEEKDASYERVILQKIDDSIRHQRSILVTNA